MKTNFTIQKSFLPFQQSNGTTSNSPKLLKLKYLLENSPTKTVIVANNSFDLEKSKKLSKDLPLFLSLIEKPINLLFSIDQFLFENSKKTYQQKKTGEFFQQLKERKKLSLFYGHLTRKQINTLFAKAFKTKGYFAKNVFSLLERRLDVVIYRSGFTQTISEARQLIKHNKILVNDIQVNVPSYSLQPGDIIALTTETLFPLTHQVVNGLKLEKSKRHLKSFEDYYSKLKKNLDTSNLQTNKKDSLKKSFQNKLKKLSISHNFSSKLICHLLIQCLFTRTNSRCFWNLTRKAELNRDQTTIPLISQSRFSFQNNVLTVLKWKSGSFLKKGLQKNLNKKSDYRKDADQLETLYANGGSLQKKPKLWVRNLINVKQRKMVFSKNQKLLGGDQKKFSYLKNKNHALFQTSFDTFLKYLDSYRKFSGLVALHFKKSLFKRSFYKTKSSFSKPLGFRTTKPMHLEISYNLLNIIFLYSPQRVNFPFHIDLDLIKRSLR